MLFVKRVIKIHLFLKEQGNFSTYSLDTQFTFVFQYFVFNALTFIGYSQRFTCECVLRSTVPNVVTDFGCNLLLTFFFDYTTDILKMQFVNIILNHVISDLKINVISDIKTDI